MSCQYMYICIYMQTQVWDENMQDQVKIQQIIKAD